MKESAKHIDFLDHVRGGAILLVFLYHCDQETFLGSFHFDELPWHGWMRDFHVPHLMLALLPATIGWAGVSIFFAVSGFCIHLSHERSRLKGWKVYFLRRFFRIYPPYLIALLFFALVDPDTKLDFGQFWLSDTGNLISHVFLVHNLIHTYLYSINGVFWSIGVEVQLYALYPLLYWLAGRYGWQCALALTAVVEIGFRCYYGVILAEPTIRPYAFLLNSPLIYWFSWSVGAAAAEAYLKGTSQPLRNFPLWLGLLLFIVCYAFRPLFPFCFMLAALVSTQIIVYLLERPQLVIPSQGWKGVTFKFLQWSGISSYSAYLIHHPIMPRISHLFENLLGTTAPSNQMVFFCNVLSWIFILPLSLLLYRFLELPSIALGKRAIAKLGTNRELRSTAQA